MTKDLIIITLSGILIFIAVISIFSIQSKKTTSVFSEVETEELSPTLRAEKRRIEELQEFVDGLKAHHHSSGTDEFNDKEFVKATRELFNLKDKFKHKGVVHARPTKPYWFKTEKEG